MEKNIAVILHLGMVQLYQTQIRKGEGSVPFRCKSRKCVQKPVLKNCSMFLLNLYSFS